LTNPESDSGFVNHSLTKRVPVCSPEDIGLSRVQLYRKITALTGMAVNEMIRKMRLQKAAQLLQQKWGPVSQVAYEVGFSNLSYFSKVFREEYGVLPSEYS
jgi:AraC-like DNA-binding protein